MKYSLFFKISDEDKNSLIKSLEADTYTFKKDTSIFSYIKTAPMIVLVQSGDLYLTRNDYDGNKIISETFTTGDVFGTKLNDFSYDNCDIITKKETTLLVFDEYILMNSKLESPAFKQFRSNLIEVYLEVIEKRNDRIRILTKKTIRNRLLEYFSIQVEKTGKKLIVLPISYTALADYLGVDRSAMTREIGNLKDERLINVKGKRIEINY